MRINNKKLRTIWFEDNILKIINQTKLPHKFEIKDLPTNYCVYVFNYSYLDYRSS